MQVVEDCKKTTGIVDNLQPETVILSHEMTLMLSSQPFCAPRHHMESSFHILYIFFFLVVLANVQLDIHFYA